MTLGQLLGLIAIIVGIVSAVIGKVIVHMNPLDWFVLAIALVVTLGVGVVPVPGMRREP